MTDVQAKRLMEMMDYAPLSYYLEVSLPLFESKKSSPIKLAEGDIIKLPMYKLEVRILDEDYGVIAQGGYGIYNDTPSILIESSQEKLKNSIDNQKYKKFRITLGKIKREELDHGKVITLHQDTRYDAILYRDDTVVAYAHLVQVDQKIALQIGEVK